MSETLTIQFKGELAARIKDSAKKLGVSRTSLCRAGMRQMIMQDGGQHILTPWGSADFEDVVEIKKDK